MSEKRTEGWGSLDNARDAHYFTVDARSLCGRWAAWRPPYWESNQELGDAPSRGTCKSCWTKRKKQMEAKP